MFPWDTTRLDVQIHPHPPTHVYHFLDESGKILTTFKRVKGRKDIIMAKDVPPPEQYRTNNADMVKTFFFNVVKSLTKPGTISLFPVPIGARWFVVCPFVNRPNELGEVLYYFDLRLADPKMNYVMPSIEGHVVNQPPYLHGDVYYMNGAGE